MTISVDFDAGGFKESIRFAMQMGASPDASKRAQFIFPAASRTYWKDGTQITPTPPVLDQDGNPLDLDVEVRLADPVIVYQRKDEDLSATTIDCSIEFQEANAQELPTGLNLRPTKLIVTTLDVDHAKVQGCHEVLLGADRYIYSYEMPALGMFEVGVFQQVFFALDET